MTGNAWTDYIAGRPDRLPRGGGETWAEVSPAERRRVDRNYLRWRRRLDWEMGRPIHFIRKGNEVVVEQYPGRSRRPAQYAPNPGKS